MAAKHSKSQNVTASIHQVIALIRDSAFASSLKIEMKSENRTETGVWYRFHSGTSMTSWGEKITITLTHINPTNVRVDILSECGMPTQIIDWGKNKKNVTAIYNYILANVGKYAPPAPAPAPQPAPAPAPQPAPEAASTGGDKKFCFKCGTQLSGSDAFCSKCGTKQA